MINTDKVYRVTIPKFENMLYECSRITNKRYTEEIRFLSISEPEHNDSNKLNNYLVSLYILEKMDNGKYDLASHENVRLGEDVLVKFGIPHLPTMGEIIGITKGTLL